MAGNNGGVGFKILSDGRFELSTAAVVDADELVNRIVSIESQKENFKMQAEMAKNQIELAKMNIESLEKNIGYATDDLEKAYQFLKANHREDLLIKIEKRVNENKEAMKKGEESDKS